MKKLLPFALALFMFASFGTTSDVSIQKESPSQNIQMLSDAGPPI